MRIYYFLAAVVYYSLVSFKVQKSPVSRSWETVYRVLYSPIVFLFLWVFLVGTDIREKVLFYGRPA